MMRTARNGWNRVKTLADVWSRARPYRWRIRSLLRGMRQHQAARVASAMAFELFLAGIPMLALVGWGLGKVMQGSDAATVTTALLLDLTPEQVNGVVTDQLARSSGTSALAPLALFGSWWLAGGAFHRVMSVFETALRARRRRWWKKRLLALGCVAAWLVALGVSASVVLLLAGGSEAWPTLLRASPADGAGRLRLVALALGYMTTTALTAAFFRIAVSRPGIRRRVWPGAVLSVTLGAAVSAAFSYYAQKLASYTVFYGSLTAVAVVLIWLWLCCAAMLLGAELNAQLEGLERRTMPPSERL